MLLFIDGMAILGSFGVCCMLVGICLCLLLFGVSCAFFVYAFLVLCCCFYFILVSLFVVCLWFVVCCLLVNGVILFA